MKTKILIVDDLKENLHALSRLIEHDDLEIFMTASPDEALSLILDHDFGLALFDVQMPLMSGFELARLVRGVERGRDLPVIFVTAHTADSELIFEGYRSGAVDLLFKPLDPHIVRSKVRVFVRLDQQSRQLETQIDTMARLKEEAESANVAKTHFLANMSHEIRTPLNAVLGFADILSHEELPTNERGDYLSSISRNGKLLLRIIDDILDISRIEADRLALEIIEFEAQELVSDIETTLARKAAEKKIQLTFESDPYFEGRFVSDPLRIKQILLNVIGNAIKFTHVGEVRVKATRQIALADGMDELKFVIEDTGIGLAVADAEKLFKPFAQADSSTRRQYGGTGLGLSISQQLARNLGGDVTLVSSKAGEGSQFEIRLRGPGILPSRLASRANLTLVPSAPPATPALDLAQLLAGKRILVVDDVTDNRTLIDRYLRSQGVQLGQASGGQEAIDQVRDHEWDVILMDIQMPLMDGYETTRRLRELGFRKPIIALTAHAMRDELDRCLAAGCNMTMTKPVAKRDLIERLASVTH